MNQINGIKKKYMIAVAVIILLVVVIAIVVGRGSSARKVAELQKAMEKPEEAVEEEPVEEVTKKLIGESGLP